MKIFLTSDHHFFHSKIIKYSSRPFQSVEEMNEVMIERWNYVVGNDDLVIHLGDFALTNGKTIQATRERLNGTILLLKGSHDDKLRSRHGFIITKSPIYLQDYIMTHEPLQKGLIPKGYINVHGHLHEKDSLYGINISVEKTNYQPIELANLKEFCCLAS